MIRFTGAILLAFSGCTQTSKGPSLPTDAGLPADVSTLAVAPLQAPTLTASEDISGVTFVPTSAPTTHAAVALPTNTPPLTQTLWVRQVARALPDLSANGVTLEVVDTAGLVVWTLHGPQQARAAALTPLIAAIANPQLTDDGLAGALSTRPHSSDPADPVTLRTLHEQTAVTRRLWVSADSVGRDHVAPSVQDWQPGAPVDDGDAWLSERAETYAASASCQIGNIGDSTPDTVRRVANGLVVRQATSSSSSIPLTAEVWRAGRPDFFQAMQQRIEQAPLPEGHTMNDCTFQ